VLTDSDLVAFVASSDLDRSRAFYEGVLGLPLVEETSFACVFDAHGTQLRVTAVAEVARPGYTVLGWQVTDLAASIDHLVPRGVQFARFDGVEQDDRGVWTTPNGDRVAWFTDPEGNVLSLTQLS
jgi:catechol 2,3-dioxygenase-like lactoylglutathione lyase family enzyme